jgi:hypothetical protein
MKNNHISLARLVLVVLAAWLSRAQPWAGRRPLAKGATRGQMETSKGGHRHRTGQGQGPGHHENFLAYVRKAFMTGWCSIG